MSNKCIIHTNTRIILRLTKDDNPELRAFESAVIVAADFNIGGGPFKLEIDGVTKSVPTQSEINATLDDAYPQRKTKRALLLVLDDITSDTNLPGKLRQLTAALKNFYGTSLQGGE